MVELILIIEKLYYTKERKLKTIEEIKNCK